MTFLELYGTELDRELGTTDRTQRFTTARRKAAINAGQLEFVRRTECLTREGLAVVFSPEARAGMGHSLAAGVATTPEAAGWLVTLADMPFLRVDTVQAVMQALAGGAALAAPVCAGRRGHPVGFAARWRDELQGLTGDEGARALLGRHRALIVGIETDDAGVLRDVDVREDLGG